MKKNRIRAIRAEISVWEYNVDDPEVKSILMEILRNLYRLHKHGDGE